MNVAERLRQAVQGVPDEGAVTLPVEAVRRWLEEADDAPSNGAGPGKGAPVADLTVSELADELDKSESTVRSWMPEVEGAYRLGAEWRVSRAAWRRHLDRLAADGDEGPPTVRSGAADLGDWRAEREDVE